MVVFRCTWCGVVVKGVHVGLVCTCANEEVPVKGVAYGYKEEVCGLGRFVCDGVYCSVSEV